ncbi:MAG: hypothetical protein ACREXW_00130 [Gammaproteobacteria bacterium]
MVFIPKCRRQTLHEELRRHLGKVFRRFAGYFVSTVGRDKGMIREYIRHQEREDQRLESLNLWR